MTLKSRMSIIIFLLRVEILSIFTNIVFQIMNIKNSNKIKLLNYFNFFCVICRISHRLNFLNVSTKNMNDEKVLFLIL